MNIRRRHFVPRSLIICIGLVLAAVIFSISEGWSAQAINTGCCINEKPPLAITSGKTATFSVEYTCFNSQGQDANEYVTIQVSGLPKGADFQPGATKTFTSQTITITTSKDTPPGNYQLTVTGKSSTCPTYTQPICPETLTIKPTITSEGNKSAVWWFNGQNPTGFTKQLTLTAKPVGVAKYTWNVDGQYGQIEDQSKNPNPAEFKANCQTDPTGTGPCPPQGEGNVTVTVTANGATSDPFKAQVLTPYEAMLMDVPPDVPDNAGAGALFYFSHIPYQITDQFGKPLPVKPPVREHFTGAQQSQCSFTKLGITLKCNWHASHEGGSGEAGRLGGTGCSTGGPGVVCDTISGQAKDQAPLVPSIPEPECPNNNCSAASLGSSTLKVLCFPGELWVGNGASPPAPPQGVRVMTMIWQRYQDHGRHCNITSPLDGSGTTVDSCTCP